MTTSDAGPDKKNDSQDPIPSEVQPRRFDRTWWWILFAALLISHVVWISWNQVPPAWDMAHHQLRGLEACDALFQGRLPAGFSRLSDYYPPLYYLQEAIVIGIFGWGLVPLLANLPGLFLLGWCGRSLAREFLEEPSASLAGLIVLLLPMVAWVSRESLLDVSLSGWVAASLLLLRRSQGLTRRMPVVLFGCAMAAGMLTKWTFVFFMIGPVAWVWLRALDKRQAALRLMDAALVALPPILWWYLPNAGNLLERFRLTSQAGVAENDPSWTSIAGWIYYVRCLASYYFGLPMLIPFVWGLVRAFGKGSPVGESPASHFKHRNSTTQQLSNSATRQLSTRPSTDTSHFALRTSHLSGPSHCALRTFLWSWLLAGIVVLTLLPAKDPRYVMPLALPAVLLLFHFWRDSARAVGILTLIAVIQYAAVSFPLTPPFKLAFFEYDPPEDYRTLSQEWVLFQTQYLDVVGPPKKEDWHLGDIADLLPDGARVGFVPELPRFHVLALKLKAIRSGTRIEVFRLGDVPPDEEFVSGLQAIVTKSGDQGIPGLTVYNEQVRERLLESGWRSVGAWPLPDRSAAELWMH